MTEQPKQIVTINGVDYSEDMLTEQQKTLINHVADLDKKIASAKFNMDQLQVGREAFFNMLLKSLEPQQTQQ